MLSQTNEYALRVMVHLAAVPGVLKTTPQIAAVTKVPLGYLSKVLQTLTRGGFIVAQRGLHGGFSLARNPDQISVYDVVQAVDPVRRIHSCPLRLNSHGTHLCALHRRMDDIFAQVEQSLRHTTLAELLADPNPSRPLEEGCAAAPQACSALATLPSGIIYNG
jgi:Rrf2 family transcriptional regulator, nitric oxide-sensitive transcriptional repressor